MFHALALDEERPNFSPTLIFLPPINSERPNKKTNLEQCWFPGVHSDVGGSYADARATDSADISLAWMIDRCSGLLEFDDGRLKAFIEKAKTSPTSDGPTMWAAMPHHDSVTSVFKLAGREPRTPGEYQPKHPVTQEKIMGSTTNETIHPSVRVRLLKANDPKNRWKQVKLMKKHEDQHMGFTLEYAPQPLADFRLVRVEPVPNQNRSWRWVKEQNGNRIEIPEWKIKQASVEAQLLVLDDHLLWTDPKPSKSLPRIQKRQSVTQSAMSTATYPFTTSYNSVARWFGYQKEDERVEYLNDQSLL
jgi:Uncharacterized alpha/beta hydrolase domain (DUF2235)